MMIQITPEVPGGYEIWPRLALQSAADQTKEIRSLRAAESAITLNYLGKLDPIRQIDRVLQLGAIFRAH